MLAREAVGRAVGGLIAPVARQGSRLRRARVLHPDGVVYRAEVRPLVLAMNGGEGGEGGGALADIAARLAGPALVRISGGVWRWRGGGDRARPDVLGVAVRFRGSEAVSPEAEPGDQDLLFASFRSMWTLPIAPLTTNVRDFLANVYYAVLPFEVTGLGKARCRLVPVRTSVTGEDRRERLERAVSAGVAIFRFEIRQPRRPWVAIAEIALRERVDMDQQALRLTPFRTGRGIVPRGLIQAVRAAAYAASQRGRQGGSGRDASPTRA